MAIVRNGFRVSPPAVVISEEDDEMGSASTSGVSEAASDADSGMGSDEYELSELGEAGTELCQVGNQSCSIPLELYELEGLRDVLNVETWNQCLSEEERFALSAYLPDMDQETFALTLLELFCGANFHFGSPVDVLFGKLKGGLCEPRVVLYCRGLNSFLKRKHYHILREYHNSMVDRLVRIRDAWEFCNEYPMEERLHLLNIMRSNGCLSPDEVAVRSDTDSGSKYAGERVCSKRLKVAKPSFDETDVVGLNLGKYEKENRKEILNVAALKGLAKKGYIGLKRQYPLQPKHKFDKSSAWLALSQPENGDRYDSDAYGYGSRGDWEAGKGRLLKPGKKQESLKRYDRQGPVQFGDEEPESYDGLERYADMSGNADQKVTIASYGCHSSAKKKHAEYSGNDWIYPGKGQALRGSQIDQLDAPQQFGQNKMHRDAMALDCKGDFNEWIIRGKKLKAGNSFNAEKSKIETDLELLPNATYPADINDRYLCTQQRGKSSREKIRSNYIQNGAVGVHHSRSSGMNAQSEETESDASDWSEEGGDASLEARKDGYPFAEPLFDHKKANKLGKKDKIPFTELNVEPQSIKGKQKRKYMASSDYAFVQSNYMHNGCSKMVYEQNEYLGDEHTLNGQPEANASGNTMQVDSDHSPDDDRQLRMNMPLSRFISMKKTQKAKLDDMHRAEQENGGHLHTSSKMQNNDPTKMKKGKKNANAGTRAFTPGNHELNIPEKEPADVEQETELQKKPFTPIMPTVHTGFSFSIVHLLSAIRKALITPCTEDYNGIGNGRPKIKAEEHNKTVQIVNGGLPAPLIDLDFNTQGHTAEKNLPSLTVQDIVHRVRTNPLDPCILETQEPLHDLVRGVLKIFSSKTAPLGAKGWKTLVFYEKSHKSWSWIGPVASNAPDNDSIGEETSPEVWNIPHKMLVKLVDAFANWLKSGQETLQQIGSLPPPPIMPVCLEEKERFKDLRAQKSSNTINPSSDEVRAYFRREEFLRYAVPDRAFSYTAVDGKKSIVAPLRRCGGKPTSKARDHFMLKPDRPPHVTILCLVRDAAARLPGSIGTRADVCTLIRDSQYIVESVSHQQVNQVVSGALDRLHYERDPCVQFDQDRKLWVYLHRDREEEDFEDDGTSSTKKWKKQKKDPADQSDLEAVNELNYGVAGDPAVDVSSAGYGFDTDLNGGL